VEKHERLLRGDSNALIDPDGYKTYLRESERDFCNKLGRQNPRKNNLSRQTQ